jgi:hypothetical protein
MMPKLMKFGAVLVFVGATVIVAERLALFAHDELGLTRSFIREAALLCSVAICLGLFSDRFGRRK